MVLGFARIFGATFAHQLLVIGIEWSVGTAVRIWCEAAIPIASRKSQECPVEILKIPLTPIKPHVIP